MDVEQISKALDLEVVSGHRGLKRQIKGAYCGDLLSDVIANSREGDVWITIQTHQNVVAVAVLKEHACVIIAGSREPDEDTKKKSDQEGVPLLRGKEDSFRLCCRLYELGIGKG